MANSGKSIVDNTALAINPQENIAVFASAGSGKTHLLVHRILKLLLSNVDPSNILAITFTRKAATEMQERLMKVLADWATADNEQVQSILQDLSHPHDGASIAKAKKLYEELLFSEYEIRITTFHAFCQDILKRFAIHAGVPAGFHVIESNDEIKQEARKKLFKNAQQGDQELSKALFTLLTHCNTVNNVNEVLDTFINSRSDWKSFTENQKHPADYAYDCLKNLIFPKQNHKSNDLSSLTQALEEYLRYLLAHNTKTYQSYSTILSSFLEQRPIERAQLKIISTIFFTSKMEMREIKASKALEKSLGADKTQNFISLHASLSEEIAEHLDILKKEKLLEFNQAWFYSGHQLLEEYQKIKFSQHALDFDDLEWYTYLLLNQHESAAWIQYKLDQRIQHILIDEFQDTNPTQWNLLFPLLTELAIDSHENHRSLFFVGDAKQSIYGFRRANSDLQFAAAEWAKENLNAQLLETDDSYRSSPAIINFVNTVFSQPDIGLKHFNSHHAIQTTLWGQVQVNALIQAEHEDIDKAEPHRFRDPLHKARPSTEDNSHQLEGQQVATRISELISNKTPIMDNHVPRAITYQDIIILARNRTHLAQLELALNEQHIPYNSVYDEDFLSKLEVQDILCLLTYLTQSHNDLALAQVLRSPLYGMNDQDMMEIACQSEGAWHDKLKSYADTSDNFLAKQAYEQLQKWRSISNTLPVHDLLDHIYFETNLLARYASSLPNEDIGSMRSQVMDNLIALLQLSLDLDAGRYSSIQSFLASLQTTTHSKSNQALQDNNAVQIMTIHSAKGLEAPVVFLVDTGPKKSQSHTYSSIINWPSHARRPEQFFLLGRKESVDKISQSIIDEQISTQQKEELNLLYVALTRAKQYLFISGTASKSSPENSWHAIISQALSKALGETLNDEEKPFWTLAYGALPTVQTEASNHSTPQPTIPYDLQTPFPPYEATDVADLPTDDLPIDQNMNQANYGTLVHKIFELFEPKYFQDDAAFQLAIESSLGMKIKKAEFERAVLEVRNCLESTELHPIFQPADDTVILKEVPISFIKNGKVLYRIIDHLVVSKNQAWIIDYKTTRDVDINDLQTASAPHQYQMDTYLYAVKKLYPEKMIRASILYTAIPALYELET
jgi:ATP-dependent helicase/nuclease subunit A